MPRVALAMRATAPSRPGQSADGLRTVDDSLQPTVGEARPHSGQPSLFSVPPTAASSCQKTVAAEAVAAAPMPVRCAPARRRMLSKGRRQPRRGSDTCRSQKAARCPGSVAEEAAGPGPGGPADRGAAEPRGVTGETKDAEDAFCQQCAGSQEWMKKVPPMFGCQMDDRGPAVMASTL